MKKNTETKEDRMRLLYPNFQPTQLNRLKTSQYIQSTNSSTRDYMSYNERTTNGHISPMPKTNFLNENNAPRNESRNHVTSQELKKKAGKYIYTYLLI